MHRTISFLLNDSSIQLPHVNTCVGTSRTFTNASYISRLQQKKKTNKKLNYKTNKMCQCLTCDRTDVKKCSGTMMLFECSLHWHNDDTQITPKHEQCCAICALDPSFWMLMLVKSANRFHLTRLVQLINNKCGHENVQSRTMANETYSFWHLTHSETHCNL